MTQRFSRLLCVLCALALGCRTGADVLDPNDAGPDAGSAPGDGGSGDGGTTSPDGSPPPPPDGGPRLEGLWTLEAATADIETERCEARVGAPATLRVTVHASSSCDEPGPIYVEAASGTLRVRPTAWRHHPEAASCTTSGATWTRDVQVRGLTEGAWRVDGTLLALMVDSRPPAACTLEVPVGRGEMCNADCDCESGLSCVRVRGDAFCAAFCEEPCAIPFSGFDNGLACASSSDCRPDDTVGAVCEPRMGAVCESTECRAGASCLPDAGGHSRCAWTITLSAAARHTCTSDADCGLGLDCVETVGSRTCEVRCDSESMVCPPMHTCVQQSGQTGICEWLGE